MSCVQSTLRNIRLSVNFRLIFGLGHALLLRLSVERGGVIKSPRSVFLFFVGVEIVGLYRLLRARMFRSLIPVLMIKERNIRAREIAI